LAAGAAAVSGLGGITAPRRAGAAPANAVTPESVAAAVAALPGVVQDAMDRTGVPGVAVAVVYQDVVVHLAGYGVREVGASDAVDADTVFQLASVSKPLAATTVAAIVGDGIVGWDDRVGDLEPTFAMYDPWVSREVTLRDLFSHRSGLVDHAGDDLEDLGYDRAEILYRLRFLRPEGPFRAYYAYTNFGLTAAAVAAADAAGLAWEDLAATRLYERLGLSNTSSRFADYIAATNRAVPHVPADGAYVARYQRQPDAQSPAGGVSSTVRDMAQWLRLLLGNGTVDGEEIVAAAALGETFRPHYPSNQPANPAVQPTGFYGLGWNVGTDPAGRVRLNHSGAFWLGAGTTVSLVPAAELGIVVLTNARPNGVAEAISFSFMDLANTGMVANDYVDALGQYFAEQLAPKYGRLVDYTAPPTNPGPPLELAAYAGDFTNDFYGTAAVALEGDAPVLRLGPDQTAYPMRHYAHDTFLYQPVGENAAGESAVTFTIGADGLAESVTIEILDLSHQGTFTRALPTE
jgi:CubicO group peptidase (beta-lactamase class C family)